MNYWQAIVLGIVEGVTEFLPISSTGHLILVSNLLNIPQTEFVKSFEVIIQLGAILAVVLIYFKYLLQHKDLWPKIIIAFIPSAIFGLLFYKFIKSYLIGNSSVTLWSLGLGGIVLFFSDYLDKLIKDKKLDLLMSFKIGLFQTLSMIPGVSRAAATTIGGISVGMTRQKAVEFSFLLAIPTMIAATGLDLIKTGFAFNNNEYQLLALGFVTSFMTAWISIKWLLNFVQKNSLKMFGVYRIVLVLLMKTLGI